MCGWYLPDDRLGVAGEQIITPAASVEDAVARIASCVTEPSLNPALIGQVDHGVVRATFGYGCR